MNKKLFILIIVVCFAPYSKPSPYRSRSKSRNSQPTYDQKQTGDYNIQLHLKDFEIVALISDAAFGDLGDYEYNYDYSDLTVKPGVLQTTSRPISTPTHPPTLVDITSTKNPNLVNSTTSNDSVISTDFKSNVTKDLYETTSNVSKEIFVKGSIENLTILNDNEDMTTNEEHAPIVVHQRCTSGFTRDKMGRCRRVRKPQAPFSFGLSRLATLASKLRQKNESSSSNEETSGDH